VTEEPPVPHYLGVFKWDWPIDQTNKSSDDEETTQSHVHTQVCWEGNWSVIYIYPSIP
jgi:hypothetical protein